MGELYEIEEFEPIDRYGVLVRRKKKRVTNGAFTYTPCSWEEAREIVKRVRRERRERNNL